MHRIGKRRLGFSKLHGLVVRLLFLLAEFNVGMSLTDLLYIRVTAVCTLYGIDNESVVLLIQHDDCGGKTPTHLLERIIFYHTNLLNHRTDSLVEVIDICPVLLHVLHQDIMFLKHLDDGVLKTGAIRSLHEAAESGIQCPDFSSKSSHGHRKDNNKNQEYGNGNQEVDLCAAEDTAHVLSFPIS